MLFFRQIKDEKLGSAGFKSFYDQECHICSLTMALVERMEASPDKGEALLSRLDISVRDYEDLKLGDHCRPEQVLRLCRHLGMETDDRPPCPRMQPAK